MLKIDKNVPLPGAKGGSKSRGPNSAAHASLASMAVGDSFVLPARGDENTEQVRARAFRLCYQHKPKAYATRVVHEKGILVCRIWRTE